MSVDQIKVACRFSQTHIIQRLIQLNLDRLRSDTVTVVSCLMSDNTHLPMVTMQPLVSRGFFDSLSNAAQDFEVLADHVPTSFAHYSTIVCLSWVTIWQDVFELYLRTCFPFWHTLRPRRKQELFELFPIGTDWTVEAVRLLICPRGSVQAIDTQTWIDDGASLLHLVLSFYFTSHCENTTRDWPALLQEIITATGDLHHMLESLCPGGQISNACHELEGLYSRCQISGACSALKSALLLTLNNILRYGNDSPGDVAMQHGLKRLTAKLQSLMSIIATCGHDLLKFGQREAAIWVGQDETCRIAQEALIFEPDNTFRSAHGRWFLWVIHYGPEPLDWYFEWEFPQEDYAGEFWTLVERTPPTPPKPMPGTWVDED